jgi:predicted MFS family arabinose efflux permease
MTSTGRRLVPGLAITETVSWGILYYAFPVLLPAMERDLGWGRTTLIGAYTTAVIVAGIAALAVGRLLDRHPARPLMTGGSILATAGVLAWAASASVATFYAGWVAIGIAMALVLYEPAQVVLVQQFGVHATRAITTLTLVAGFASTIFQPITALLADRIGWRVTLLVLGTVLATVTIPIHLLVLPAQAVRPPHADPQRTDMSPSAPDRAATLLTVAFTLAMAAMAAGIVHLVPYLVDHGWSPVAAAVAAGTLGATQVAARVAFGPTARHVAPAHLAGGILALPAAGVIVLAVSEGNGAAWLAVAVLGIAQGTATLLRPMLLARHNGPHGYGRHAATSAATTTIARATAPLALAGIAASVGYAAGFTFFALASIGAAVLAIRALTSHASTSSADTRPVEVHSVRVEP